jgi:hypothetical protein
VDETAKEEEKEIYHRMSALGPARGPTTSDNPAKRPSTWREITYFFASIG